MSQCLIWLMSLSIFSVLNIMFLYYIHGKIQYLKPTLNKFVCAQSTKFWLSNPESFDEKSFQPLIFDSNLLEIWGLKGN